MSTTTANRATLDLLRVEVAKQERQIAECALRADLIHRLVMDLTDIRCEHGLAQANCGVYLLNLEPEIAE